MTASLITQAAASCSARGVPRPPPRRGSRPTPGGAGPFELLREVGRAITAGELAGLAQGGVSCGPHLEHLLRGTLVTACRQGGGELRLHRDGREAAPQHVVDVSGEAEPLLGDGECRLGRARLVELDDHRQEPEGDPHGEDQEERDQQGGGCEPRIAGRRGRERGERKEQGCHRAAVPQTAERQRGTGEDHHHGGSPHLVVLGQAEGQHQDHQGEERSDAAPGQGARCRVERHHVPDHAGRRRGEQQ